MRKASGNNFDQFYTNVPEKIDKLVWMASARNLASSLIRYDCLDTAEVLMEAKSYQLLQVSGLNVHQRFFTTVKLWKNWSKKKKETMKLKKRKRPPVVLFCTSRYSHYPQIRRASDYSQSGNAGCLFNLHYQAGRLSKHS